MTCPRAAGFTLLEMMAVVFLTALVIAAAVGSYLDLSHASQQAVDASRDARRAVALLDRLARDLEGTVLVVKPPAVDPLEHPWLFLAEADDRSEGARRVKFVTRSHRVSAAAVHESDLAVVALVAQPGDDGDLVLLRAVSTQLPEGLDRSFPLSEDDGAQLLAEGLDRFGMRFLTEDGEWVTDFDSSSLLRSSQLPLVVEIEVAFAPKEERDFEDEEDDEGLYQRQVILPLRPLDLEAELAADQGSGSSDEDDGSEEGEEDNACFTVQDCFGDEAALEAYPEEMREAVLSRWNDCLDDVGLTEEDCPR